MNKQEMEARWNAPGRLRVSSNFPDYELLSHEELIEECTNLFIENESTKEVDDLQDEVYSLHNDVDKLESEVRDLNNQITDSLDDVYILQNKIDKLQEFIYE